MLRLFGINHNKGGDSMKRLSPSPHCILAFLLLCALASCSAEPLLAATATASPSPSPKAINPTPGQTACETAAPGDFSIGSVITGAEKHLPSLAFQEIQPAELKGLYPSLVALPVDIRGRRAEGGVEYLVIATKNNQSIDTLTDISRLLEEAAAARAKKLESDCLVRAGDMNKFAVVVVSRNASELMTTICASIAGAFQE